MVGSARGRPYQKVPKPPKQAKHKKNTPKPSNKLANLMETKGNDMEVPKPPKPPKQAKTTKTTKNHQI
jgi:hypothetical protein